MFFINFKKSVNREIMVPKRMPPKVKKILLEFFPQTDTLQG